MQAADACRQFADSLCRRPILSGLRRDKLTEIRINPIGSRLCRFGYPPHRIGLGLRAVRRFVCRPPRPLVFRVVVHAARVGVRRIGFAPLNRTVLQVGRLKNPAARRVAPRYDGFQRGKTAAQTQHVGLFELRNRTAWMVGVIPRRRPVVVAGVGYRKLRLQLADFRRPRPIAADNGFPQRIDAAFRRCHAPDQGFPCLCFRPVSFRPRPFFRF